MSGITLHCSDCKKVLVTEAYIMVESSFKIRCPHCQSDMRVIFAKDRKLMVVRVPKVIHSLPESN